MNLNIFLSSHLFSFENKNSHSGLNYENWTDSLSNSSIFVMESVKQVCIFVIFCYNKLYFLAKYGQFFLKVLIKLEVYLGLGDNSSQAIHYVDCYLVSGVLAWVNVLSMVTKCDWTTSNSPFRLTRDSLFCGTNQLLWKDLQYALFGVDLKYWLEVINEHSQRWVESNHTHNFWNLYAFILILISCNLSVHIQSLVYSFYSYLTRRMMFVIDFDSP